MPLSLGLWRLAGTVSVHEKNRALLRNRKYSADAATWVRSNNH
jgi:hypothetical protein